MNNYANEASKRLREKADRSTNEATKNLEMQDIDNYVVQVSYRGEGLRCRRAHMLKLRELHKLTTKEEGEAGEGENHFLRRLW